VINNLLLHDIRARAAGVMEKEAGRFPADNGTTFRNWYH
jgi:hypothetical protein